MKEKLVNSLKTLDNIALSFDNNSIFSKVDSLDNALSTNFHNLGLGVKDYTISVDFVNNSPINKKIADWIKNMLKRRDNQELSALTICGRSCDGFERTMNLDLVVDEVKCNVPQDDNGMYRAELVFNSLIAEIR